jgi:hypothetical protein
VRGSFVFREGQINEDFDATDAQFRSEEFKNRNAEPSKWDVNLSRTKIGGIGRWNNTTVTGSFCLEGDDIRELDVTGLQPWPRQQGRTCLKELTCKHFRANPLETGRTRNDLNRCLEFLTNSQYDPGLYVQLENYLKETGDTELADAVFIAGQERKSDESSDLYSRIKGRFLGLVTGHGRRPWQIFIWCGAVITIGIFVFRKREWVEEREEKFKKRGYSPIWYSLDLFAPVIDLEAASVWTPRKDDPWRWFWFRLQRILGWILVPIGIIAITAFLGAPHQN